MVVEGGRITFLLINFEAHPLDLGLVKLFCYLIHALVSVISLERERGVAHSQGYLIVAMLHRAVVVLLALLAISAAAQDFAGLPPGR